jgi:hypothetical protein
MKTAIQTSKRLVTQIVTDINPVEYDTLKKILMEKRIPFDGIFIECKSKLAYVWMRKLPPKSLPPESIRA